MWPPLSTTRSELWTFGGSATARLGVQGSLIFSVQASRTVVETQAYTVPLES
jgi:hypothetical protein